MSGSNNATDLCFVSIKIEDCEATIEDENNSKYPIISDTSKTISEDAYVKEEVLGSEEIITADNNEPLLQIEQSNDSNFIDVNNPIVDNIKEVTDTNRLSSCSLSYNSMEKLENLSESHTHQTALPCNVCDKTFLYKRSLAKHKKLHLERLFCCSLCHKKFHFKKDLDRHHRVHTGEKPFRCIICMKYFSDKSTLNCHARIHTGEKPFQCNVCTKSFSQKATLRGHIISRHTDERPHECYICMKRFHVDANLKKHFRAMHTDNKHYKCDICLRHFYDKSSLNCHTRLHTGVKPFQCHICSKNFTQNVSLRNHLRLHSEEKPFECTICKKHFYDNPTLKRHFRLHTGEKPFQCNYCPKNFNRKCLLKNHLNKHSEMMAFDNFTGEQQPDFNVPIATEEKPIFDSKIMSEEDKTTFSHNKEQPTNLQCIIDQEKFPEHILFKHLNIKHRQNKPVKNDVFFENSNSESQEENIFSKTCSNLDLGKAQ